MFSATPSSERPSIYVQFIITCFVEVYMVNSVSLYQTTIPSTLKLAGDLTKPQWKPANRLTDILPRFVWQSANTVIKRYTQNMLCHLYL